MASDDEKQAALTLLAQGKRHLLVRDYLEAVATLGSACECLAKIYGDDATECGDAYFNYGKALLELARSENGVLGNAVEEEIQSGEDDDEDEENAEKEEEEPEVKPDQNGNGDSELPDSTTSAMSASKTETGSGDAGETNSDLVLNKVDTSETVTNGPSEAMKSTDEKDSDDEGDEVSNLHLAWEVLELAKSIFQRQCESDKSVELTLAEVHLMLGEVSLESENFTQGTEDMLTCLELQKKNLSPDNRRIAETYYQLGMGHGMANRFDDAIDAYTKCRKVLEERIAKLMNMVKDGVKPEGNDPFYTFEGEIKDLKQLFPEIKEKILDMQDFKNETRKAMMNAAYNKEGSDAGAGSSKDQEGLGVSTSSSFGETASTLAGSGSPSKEAKPVSNIGHLVRKKPRSEPDEESSAKRICTEDDTKQ